MVMPKTFNGITIYSKLNGYAKDSQRHNHPSWMVMPKTVNGITIHVEKAGVIITLDREVIQEVLHN
jgi:hypothetical protein